MDQVTSLLISFWLFDMDVFGNMWMWIPLGIPAFFYAIFFMFKWMIITAPIWIPLRQIFKPLRKISEN